VRFEAPCEFPTEATPVQHRKPFRMGRGSYTRVLKQEDDWAVAYQPNSCSDAGLPWATGRPKVLRLRTHIRVPSSRSRPERDYVTDLA